MIFDIIILFAIHKVFQYIVTTKIMDGLMFYFFMITNLNQCSNQGSIRPSGGF